MTSLLKRTTCKLKGHLWNIPGQTPTPNPTGSYIVHIHCLRCQLYRKEQRQAVSFPSRSK